ncbi:hypothetical protein T492DRAFT_848181 [Pavlovales sp. CCMP2436]|nr:hypothetical protein T492DRAFT_848181 [Pavlovales sp. CCMP2436]
MTTIAAAALALGVGVEHLRPALPPVLAREDAAQRSRAAMVGGGVLCVAALTYPARIAPFTALVQRAPHGLEQILAQLGDEAGRPYARPQAQAVEAGVRNSAVLAERDIVVPVDGGRVYHAHETVDPAHHQLKCSSVDRLRAHKGDWGDKRAKRVQSQLPNGSHGVGTLNPHQLESPILVGDESYTSAVRNTSTDVID